jgi:hypothetical protein
VRGLALLSVGACVALFSCEKPPAAKVIAPVVTPESLQGFARVWGDEPLDAGELELLIEALDTAARLGKGVESELAELLIGHLGGGVPKSMAAPSWHHFFNSSLNALGATPGVSREAISRTLLQIVDQEDDKVLRLYALQHLGIYHPGLSEPLRSEVGRRVAELAYRSADEVSGTALQLVEQWKGELGTDLESVSLEDRGAAALRIMTDASRPMDVRISAVQMAAEGGFVDALPAARTIASNPAEGALLRKSAIYLIGQLGVEADTALLARCATESTRLAQAAEPALAQLTGRIENRPAPKLTPYH